MKKIKKHNSLISFFFTYYTLIKKNFVPFSFYMDGIIVIHNF